VTIPRFIPPYGHSLAATLREITEEGGVAVRVELKPQSPFSGDPEFDSTDLSAWTQTNSANADAINAHTGRKSKLLIDTNATSCSWSNATRTGPFVHQTVSGDFDIYTRINLGNLDTLANGPNRQIGLLAQSTSDARDWFAVRLLLIRNSTASYFDIISTADDVTTASGATGDGFPANQFILGDVFLRLKRSGNNFSAFYSFDGNNWTQIGADTARADFSADQKLGAAVIAHADVQNTAVYAWDFLRTWPPYVTTSPVGSVVLDSGFAGTAWDMSTFNALVNEYGRRSAAARSSTSMAPRTRTRRA
jgi:hypothetical protein